MELDVVVRALGRAKRVKKNGSEYWMGRDIQEILGYAKWENFENVIEKAKMITES